MPAYRHMPGTTPHPTRDPDGHSFGAVTPVLPDLNRTDWRGCSPYLYGIDLFNLRYWWECHEALEGLWHASGPGTTAAHALQAVIQCAAAQLKTAGSCHSGASRLHDHSVRHANWSGGRCLGLDLAQMVIDTRTFLTVADAPPAQIVLEF